jgi:hypothetical protein
VVSSFSCCSVGCGSFDRPGKGVKIAEAREKDC